MKKITKTMIVFLVAFLCLSTFMSCFADDWNSVTQFDKKGIESVDTSVKNIVGAILSVIRIVGTGISIIMLTAVAIKYMSSAPGDRADIKKHAVVYVVGAVVLFGATQIIGIIQKFATSM